MMSSEYMASYVPFHNLYKSYPSRQTAQSWLQHGAPIKYEDDQYVSTSNFVAIAKHSTQYVHLCLDSLYA